MRALILQFLLCLFFITGVIAQTTYQVKGSVADTAINAKMYNATIAILNAKDSTLFKFVRANSTGEFLINSLRKGNFILLVTYPDYADFVANFALDSIKSNFDFKQLNMKLKTTLLKEVLIKDQGAAI